MQLFFAEDPGSFKRGAARGRERDMGAVEPLLAGRSVRVLELRDFRDR